MLHFICFSRPCLAAVCFASCGPLVPTIQPSMTEWCHQVNITPNSNHSAPSAVPFLSSLCSTVLLSVASTWVSAQLTVSASPLAGMTMAPHLEGHEIAFNASDRKSWKKYARSMDEYLKCESLVIVIVADEVVEFVQNEAGMQWVNPHLHYLCPLFPFGSCRACWEGKPLCGQSAAIQCVFFFTPRFCQASLIRGLGLAGHCCSKALFMLSSLILPPSLSAAFSLLSICSIQRWRSGEEEYSLCTGQILHAGRLGGERRAESVSV